MPYNDESEDKDIDYYDESSSYDKPNYQYA